MSVVGNTREYQRKYYIANAEKRRESSRKYRAANPDKMREFYRTHWIKYQTKIRSRKGLPAATRPKPELCERNCGREAKCLDHDHITGKFRGWLCRPCNMGLGLLGDTLQDLQASIDYLMRPQT